MRHARAVAIVVGVLAVAVSPARSGEHKQLPSEMVATIGGAAITAADLEQAGAGRLFSLRTQEYQLKRQLLEEAIAKRLVENEAERRHTSVLELLRLEVEAKVPPVTEAAQRDFYEKNKARFGQASETDALKQIEQGLRQQGIREKHAEYLKGLRTSGGVKVLLAPPRLTISAGDDPSRGPTDAPVTIVEFSDFQCPYCARATPTLKQVEETYAGKVRRVFRDLPLTSIHREAAAAAEAASCANDQGRFWEMHDQLFANPSKLQLADLKRHAVDLGLDSKAFDACLDSGKYRAEWQQDVEEAVRYGLTGTPAFFVNGRLLTGAQPFEAFARIIDEELELAAADKKHPKQASR